MKNLACTYSKPKICSHASCSRKFRSRTALACASLFLFFITTHTLSALAEETGKTKAIDVNVVQARPVVNALMGQDNSLFKVIKENFKDLGDGGLRNNEDDNTTAPRYSLNFNLTQLIIDLTKSTENSNLSANGKEIFNQLQEAITPKAYSELGDYQAGLIKNSNKPDTLNAETFLTAGTYLSTPADKDTPQAKKDDQFSAAQNYFDYLTNLSPSLPAFLPPTATKQGEKEPVPYYLPDGSYITISNSKFEELTAPNKNRPAYIGYLLKYRSYMAARSLFLNNIWYSLAKRSKLDTKSNKSLAEIDRDQAYWRLKEKTKGKDGKEDQPSYYDNLKKATSIDIQRDTAMMLAEMNRRLYELQQTEERVLLTQSVAGLSNMSSSQATIDQQAKMVSTFIGCSLGQRTDCPKNQ